MSTRKLVFYSGGQKAENRILHEGLAYLAGEGKNKSFTYVPYTGVEADWYFRRAIRRYEQYGFSKFYCLPVDQKKLSQREINRALSSDVIYLAGGNTFHFLKHLRRQKLITKLHDYALQGGVLAGLSAGGILMTPTIYLAKYPREDADTNSVKLKNLKALNIVGFEFYPHYYSGNSAALLRYSKRIDHPIIACTDGSGIIMYNETAEFFGKVWKFYRGTRYRLR